MVIPKGFGKVSVFGRTESGPVQSRGWTQQDIADLYRISEQLTRLGFPVFVQTGQSDEDDPWATFQRQDTDEVVVHVARIDGELIIVDVVRDRIHRGSDFRSLANELLAEAPLTLPRAEDRGNVVLHPRMVMTAFVAAAFVLSEFANPTAAQAAASGEGDGSSNEKTGHPRASEASSQSDVQLVEKNTWRDGMSGVQIAQAMGMSGLAASIAALSTHLLWGAVDTQIEGLGENRQEATSLFDGPTSSQPLNSALFEEGLSLNEHALVPDLLGNPHITPSNTGAKDNASTLVDYESFVFATTTPTPEALLLAEEGETENPGFIVIDRLADDEVLHPPLLILQALQLESDIVLASNNLSYKAEEAFDRVAASVIVLSQSDIPTLQLDGETEGAIVVRRIDLPENTDTASELIDTFAASPSAAAPVAPTTALTQQYQLVSELSQSIHLTSDVANVLVYAGGDVGVTGFTFGRDSIVFIEDLTPPDWLASVDVVGADVVLVGNGGSVTLFGAVATFI